MKYRSAFATLSVIAAMWFCLAFECGKDNDESYSADEEQTETAEQKAPEKPAKKSQSAKGFAKGHKLNGRWMNSDQGRKYFIFAADGTFSRTGVSSGTSSGGSTEYVSEDDNSGTYILEGQSLELNFNNGQTEQATIKINPFSDEPDYTQKTPTRLNISNGSYTGSYTNVGGN
jgi:hypothetical protein